MCPLVEVKCKREGLGFIFVGTPSGIVGVLISKTTPSGNPFPGGSRDKGNVRLISEQTISPFTQARLEGPTHVGVKHRYLERKK